MASASAQCVSPVAIIASIMPFLLPLTETCQLSNLYVHMTECLVCQTKVRCSPADESSESVWPLRQWSVPLGAVPKCQ